MLFPEKNMANCDTSYWRVNLWMLWVSQLLIMAGFSAMIPFVPLFIKNELGIVDETDLAFYVTMFNVFGTAAYAIFTPLNGILGDRFGIKIMLLRGTFVTAFLFPIMGYVSTAWPLIILRFLTAACAGTTAASQAMLARTVPDAKQGFALSILTTSFWGGMMLGNVIGGLIIHYYDYKAAFWMCGIMYFIAGFAILPTRDSGVRNRPAKGQPGTPGKSRAGGLLPKFSGAVWAMLGLLFLLGILRHFEAPFIALKIETVAPAGEAAYWTGIISAVVSVGALFGGMAAGFLIDRYPPNRLLVPMLTGSALMLAWNGFSTGIPGFTVSRTLLFIICGGVQPLLQKLLANLTPQEQRGSAFGVGTCVMCLGGVISAVLAGWCVMAFSLNSVFYAAALISLLSIPIMVPVIRKFAGRRSISTQTGGEK